MAVLHTGSRSQSVQACGHGTESRVAGARAHALRRRPRLTRMTPFFRSRVQQSPILSDRHVLVRRLAGDAEFEGECCFLLPGGDTSPEILHSFWGQRRLPARIVVPIRLHP